MDSGCLRNESLEGVKLKNEFPRSWSFSLLPTLPSPCLTIENLVLMFLLFKKCILVKSILDVFFQSRCVSSPDVAFCNVFHDFLNGKTSIFKLVPFQLRLTMATAYLILYNLAQTLGWTYIMAVGVRAYCDAPEKLYSAVELPLQIFQTLAVLEVVHALVGFVRSNVFVTAFQVASRVFLVWPILAAFTDTQSSIGFPMLLAAWTVTEIIRYG